MGKEPGTLSSKVEKTKEERER